MIPHTCTHVPLYLHTYIRTYTYVHINERARFIIVSKGSFYIQHEFPLNVATLRLSPKTKSTRHPRGQPIRSCSLNMSNRIIPGPRLNTDIDNSATRVGESEPEDSRNSARVHTLNRHTRLSAAPSFPSLPPSLYLPILLSLEPLTPSSHSSSPNQSLLTLPYPTYP